MKDSKGKALIVVGDASETVDTLYPYYRLIEAGIQPVVIAPEKRKYQMVLHEVKPGWTITKEWEGYSIEVDLWSTALVFDKGHRIALHVASSNYPRFGVHSNTWEPILSFDDAVIADNTVHHNAARSSHVILPVTKIYE